jgi:hypothetical protein
MGVASLDWYKKNGLTRRVSKVLQEDSTISSKKKGDILEFDEIIEQYSCGRIDVRGTGMPYGDEISVDPMMAEDWYDFGDWLETVKTDEMLTLKQLVEMYEITNPKIRWWEDKNGK